MVRNKIHGFDEITAERPAKFFVLTRVLWELQVKAKQDKKIKREVAIVKELLKKNGVKEIESKNENADDEMLAKSKEFVVATNDKELRERIKSFGGRSIYIRSLSFIEMGALD